MNFEDFQNQVLLGSNVLVTIIMTIRYFHFCQEFLFPRNF
jgi:hypothetical protein